MKVLSPILKVVALLAAAFCVYAWFDVKGRISEAESHMAKIDGATLAEKAPNVAKLYKENQDRKVKIASFEKRVKSLEKDTNALNDELESERSKNVAAMADIEKRKSEARALNSKLAVVSRKVEERDSTIEALKKEILAKQELLANQGDTDSLKDKIAELERKLSENEKLLEAAQQKAKLAEMSEVVEVIETDADGNKVKRKIVKTPYVPTGDIATVISEDSQKGFVTINKGKKAGINAQQTIILKKDGNSIAEAIVSNVSEDMAVLMLTAASILPEYVTVNKQFELAAPVVKVSEPKEGDASASTEEAPAQETATE